MLWSTERVLWICQNPFIEFNLIMKGHTMFKQIITAAIATLTLSMSATAQNRIVVEHAPSPAEYAEMFGLDLAAKPALRTRGIRMIEPTPAQPAAPAPAPAAAPSAPAAPSVKVAAPVNFELDSAAIPASFQAHLDNLAVVLQAPAAQGKVLLISGHTDSQGGASYNLDLSNRRAAAVRHYLAQKGVNPTQLIAFGKGEYELIQGRESDHAVNRRVEFQVTG
ncbi:MAG: OmpA family protein [Pseudomonadota bacterium]